MKKVPLKSFAKEIQNKFQRDSLTIRDKLAEFIDQEVIKKNFNGFKEHAVGVSYAKRKKGSKIGEETGRLKKESTSFTKWSLYSHFPGRRGIILIKKRAGLTPYSHLVHTIGGGEIDFLKMEDSNVVELSAKIRSTVTKMEYKSNAGIKLLKKSFPDVQRKKKIRKLGNHEIIKVRGINSYREIKAKKGK